jgi:DNA-binding FadR family transcriptional regulator
VRSAIDHLEKGLKERGAIGVKVAPAHGRFAFLATTELKPEELVVRLRSGAISEERFVAEMVSLRKAFEKIVGELTLETKSSALAAMASLKVSESQTGN